MATLIDSSIKLLLKKKGVWIQFIYGFLYFSHTAVVPILKIQLFFPKFSLPFLTIGIKYVNCI